MKTSSQRLEVPSTAPLGLVPVPFALPKVVPPISLSATSVVFPGWKRGLDIVCILLSLPLWLPLMLLIVGLLKLVSPGPVFFRQQRVGHGGKLFTCLKFRSMKVNTETRSHEGHLESLMRSNTPMTKLDASGDTRLLPGARLFRATGLDELPQIFNVLCGEMSVVGPRPCTPHEFMHYQPWQRDRVNAPPGLTGYWQVSGKNKTTFIQMIEMDIFYSKAMSLGLDVAIILKTVPALLMQVLESRLKARETSKPQFVGTLQQEKA